MIKPWLILLVAATMAWGGCALGPAHPGEEEVKTILAGRYCSEDLRHRMELRHDGRYAGHRSSRSAFGTGILPEKCEGNYKLRYDDAQNAWILVIEPSDKNSNPFIKCKGGEVTVWHAEKGYLVGDSIVTLNDPIDQAPVSSKCDL
jgi:hypothetical protein